MWYVDGNRYIEYGMGSRSVTLALDGGITGGLLFSRPVARALRPFAAPRRL